MAKLFVGVWAVGTQTPTWVERDRDARCAELENALTATETLRGKQKGDPNGLFVAPEYMFSLEEAKRPQDARFQMDAANAQMLKTRLSELSKQFPKILLVPGSIAFSKSLDFNEEGTKRAMKWHGQLTRHKAALASGSVRPPNLEEEAKAHKLKLRAFEERAKEWARTRGATKLTIARNAAYGYLDGTKVFACRKRTELSEIHKGNDTFYINAGESTVWSHGGVTFGVEICKDAADGYLGKVAKETVDVQIVISASLGIDDIQACARQCIVHAAQQHDQAGVFTATKGTIPALKNSQTEIAEFKLDFFLVEVGGG
jgi:hypothetical protein